MEADYQILVACILQDYVISTLLRRGWINSVDEDISGANHAYFINIKYWFWLFSPSQEHLQSSDSKIHFRVIDISSDGDIRDHWVDFRSCGVQVSQDYVIIFCSAEAIFLLMIFTLIRNGFILYHHHAIILTMRLELFMLDFQMILIYIMLMKEMVAC